MKNELKNLRSVIESCYLNNYKITHDKNLILESSIRGFKTEKYLFFMFCRVSRDGILNCLEIFNKENGQVEESLEGEFFKDSEEIKKKFLCYNINISEESDGISWSNIKAFENGSHLFAIYTVFEGVKSLECIKKFDKIRNENIYTDKEGLGVTLRTFKEIDRCFSKNNIDITLNRIFLDEYSVKGIEFKNHLIINYRGIKRDNYINSNFIKLIDLEEKEMSLIRESPFMLDDESFKIWKLLNTLTELQRWQADVLKGYSDIKNGFDNIVIEGDGKFVIDISTCPSKTFYINFIKLIFQNLLKSLPFF